MPAAYIMAAMQKHGGPDGCNGAKVVGGDLAEQTSPDGVERIVRHELGIHEAPGPGDPRLAWVDRATLADRPT